MRLVSIIIVVFALVLAGGVFFAVPRLMNRNAQVAQQGQAQVVQAAGQDVLVAAHSLPAGTVLKSDDLRWQRWPLDGIDPSFLVREKGADPQKDAVGLIVLRGIEQGEPVTAFRLLKPGEAGFLAAALTPGKRAVTIQVSAVTSAGGFINPLDRVDVVLNEHYSVTPPPPPQGGPSPPQVTTKDVSTVILRDVKVLAIDQTMQDIDSKPRVGNTATLEVDSQDAQKIGLATQLGSLTLVLRSHTPATPPETETVGAKSVVEDFDVSPFRAAVLQEALGILGAQQARTVGAPPPQGGQGGMLRVYHGAALAGARQ